MTKKGSNSLRREKVHLREKAKLGLLRGERVAGGTFTHKWWFRCSMVAKNWYFRGISGSGENLFCCLSDKKPKKI